VSARPEYGPSWFVSPWNFRDPEVSSAPRPFVVHDVTLRDGEQMAGVIFSAEEKVEIAAALDGAGVDRIEAGMVAVSEEDREAIRAIVASRPRAEIWTIARAMPADVEMALECGVAGTGVILLANEQYCRIFRWTLEDVVAKAIDAATQALDGGLATTLLIADSTRMTEDRLRYIVETATRSRQFRSLALMDTFGALSPHGTRAMILAVREMTDLPIEFHGHNDFGVGTANALVAWVAGAAVVHTSVIGLGERIGNALFEEVVLAARLLYGAESSIDLSQLTAIATLVSEKSGVTTAPNKPVVGRNFTRIESGAVASEFLRWSAMPDADMQWLFPYTPEVVGGPPVELVLCKGSGVANIDQALDRIGRKVPDASKAALVDAVKQEASRLHRELTLDEFGALAAQTTG
jgi:isopropylmalate/homocitrate/citramalate synthase